MSEGTVTISIGILDLFTLPLWRTEHRMWRLKFYLWARKYRASHGS